MSFGFQVRKDTWDETGDMPVRTIQAVDLYEVSAVAFPAYDDTSIALRSLDDAREAKKVIGKRNSEAAERRIAARKAETEMRLRGISPAKK
jgi:phage head maturation protease